MPSTPNLREGSRPVIDWVKWLLFGTALIAGGIALHSLWAWWVGDWSMAAYGDSLPMTPIAAFLLVLLSIALCSHQRWASKPAERIMESTVALVTTISALAVIIPNLAGIRPNWEHWFAATEATVRGGAPVGHMSPFTALALLLAATSQLLLPPRLLAQHWARRAGMAANLLSGGFSLVTALAYGSNTPLFYGGAIVPMAFTESVALTVLNVGLLLAGGTGHALSEWWTPVKDSSVPASERAFRRRLFLIAVSLAGTLTVAGFFYLQGEQAAAFGAAQDELNAVANLKVEQIHQWRDEWLSEARFLARTPAVATDIAALLARPSDPTARANVRAWLESIKGGEQHETVALFDVQRNLLLTIPESAQPVLTTSPEQLGATLAHHEILLNDPQPDRSGAPHLDLLIPISLSLAPTQAAQREPPALGAVILLRLNPKHHLARLIRTWPTPSDSAEALLVRVEGDKIVYLIEPRQRRGTSAALPGSMRELMPPVARGAWNNTDIRMGPDYRGVAVFAKAKAVPDSQWLLVVKVDQQEIYAPMLRQARLTGALVLVLLLAVFLGAVGAWRQRYAAYLDRALVLERESHMIGQRLELVMQHANDIILLMDESGRILEANAQAVATYGYTVDELRQLPPSGLRPPAAAGGLAEHLSQFDRPEGVTFETVHQRKDGTTFPVEASGRSVVIMDHHFKFGIYRDITRRKEYEAQIERLTRLYSALSQVNQAIIRAGTREKLFTEICRVLVEFGRFKMVWIGWHDPATAAIVPIAQFGDQHAYLTQIRVYADNRPEGQGLTGTAFRESRTCVSNDLLHDLRMEPWRNAADLSGFRSSLALPVRVAGQTAGTLSVYAGERDFFGDKEIALLEEAATDISFALDNLEKEQQRRRSETALRESEERYHGLFNSMQEGFFLAEVIEQAPGTVIDFRFLDVNPAYSGIIGKTREEVIGRTAHEVFPGLEAPLFATVGRVALTGQPAQYQRFDPVTKRHYEYVFYSPGSGRFASIFSDVTERVQSRAKLEQQAELLDKASEAIIVADLDHRVTFWNHGAERLFGYTAAEMTGKSVTEVLSLGMAAGAADINAGIGTTGQWRGEIRGFDRQGQPLIIETGITLIRDAADRPTGHLIISTNITEKKNLEEQFMRAQRLESIGMLAAGIAHDLNNVLAPILMAANMLRDQITDERYLRLLATVEKNTERGAGLVRQILGFAHGVGGEPRLVQTKHILRDVVEVIEATFPKSIVLEHNIPSDLWPIMANPTQLHQVLLNFCVNARDAMPEGGTLRLRGENCMLDELAAAQLEEARPGAWLVLHIEDTGTGIAPEVLPHIWEAFFTTKSAGKGTGLGLATVRGIVTTHHGFITLATKPGQGTQFRVYLPAEESAIASAASVRPAPLPRGHDELILVVDDEQSIRDVANSILKKFGYRVLMAEDGAAGAALFAAHAAEISLVITDLDMPNLSGAGLARQIRQLNPAMMLLVMSGADQKQSRPTESPDFASAFLMKPFTAESLLSQVHRLLHPGAPPA